MIPLDDIRAAREALAGTALRTPLVRLHADAPAEIYLKLENLQPIGSFKIRGAFNAMSRRSPRGARARGVITASAGNMAQGVAWGATLRGIPCTVVVPDYAPRDEDRGDRAARRHASIPVPFADWWQAIDDLELPGRRRRVHPPRARRRGDGGQRHDRARAARGPARPRRRRDPVGRRRAHLRHRERPARAQAGRAHLLGRARDRRADGRVVRRGRVARGRRLPRVVRRRLGQQGAAAQDVGARPRR